MTDWTTINTAFATRLRRNRLIVGCSAVLSVVCSVVFVSLSAFFFVLAVFSVTRRYFCLLSVCLVSCRYFWNRHGQYFVFLVGMCGYLSVFLVILVGPCVCPPQDGFTPYDEPAYRLAK